MMKPDRARRTKLGNLADVLWILAQILEARASCGSLQQKSRPGRVRPGEGAFPPYGVAGGAGGEGLTVGRREPELPTRGAAAARHEVC